MEGREFRNRLASERSPYLLQHADNPVDWYPWGDEALQRARQENRPIFLSIGYSTCHWCHEMLRESFRDEEVAALLNRTFVCIKVDREERPDVDLLFMRASQLMTGTGGWPLNLILTPGLRPFFAATYLPKRSRGQMIGLLDLIPAVERLWSARREELEASGELVIRTLRELPGGPERPDESVLKEAFLQMKEQYDPEYGGFGRAPKFPSPHYLLFLLRLRHMGPGEDAAGMVERTLMCMYSGGIYDHVGSGFHRYTVDRKWLFPHFEKTLYDQAYLAALYTEAALATGRRIYFTIAREVIGYMLRELQCGDGAFASGEDAESSGVEGGFYLWDEEELASLLEGDELRAFHEFYVLNRQNSRQERADGRPIGGVLSLNRKVLGGFAEGEAQNVNRERMERLRTLLFRARSRRERPGLDTKVLMDWNGYACAALAIAGRAMEEPALVRAAERSIACILPGENEGKLVHVKGGKNPDGVCFASDYAGIVWALIELYQSTFEPRHLGKAISLHREFLDRFLDSEHGGFFFTPQGSDPLPVRTRDEEDGPVPSSSALALQNTIRLSRLTGDARLEELSRELLSAVWGRIRTNPLSFIGLLCGYTLLLSPPLELVIAGPEEDPEATEMLRAAWGVHHPGIVVHRIPAHGASEELLTLVPHLEGLRSDAGVSTAFVCADRACRRSIATAGELEAFLRGFT